MFLFPGSLVSSREDTPPNLSNTTFGYISSDGEGSGGHFIVIRGVDNSSDNIRIIDPGFGEVLNVTHSWLNDGWNDEETHHHKWSDTLQIDY
jgi:hypothetical protein